MPESSANRPPSGAHGATAPSRSGLFPATRWSLVFAANAEGPVALRAMGELLQAYWKPLYVFARRSGMAAEDAQDRVQGFYESFISRESLQTARKDLGRLRSFFLQAFQNYLRDVYRSGRREKRGGGGPVLSLDDLEERLVQTAVDNVTPEVAYERYWVYTLLMRVLDRLRIEHESRGKADQFALLEPALAWNNMEMNYAEAALRLSMSEAAVQQAVKRMRVRYRKLLEEEIAQTVDGPEAVPQELEHLIKVVSAG